MVDMGVTDVDRLAIAAALTTLQRERETDIESVRTAAATAQTTDEADGDFADIVPDILVRLPGIVRSGNDLRYTLTPDGYGSWS